jgi:hypothetical protein
MNFEKYTVTEPDVFPLVLSKRLIRILKDIDDNISDEILVSLPIINLGL